MTENHKNQIELELEELTRSKQSIESKIASLNHELFKIKSAEENDRLNFKNHWFEDADQLERIDYEITNLHKYFESINSTAFDIIRCDRMICLCDTSRYIDIDRIEYNRKNLDELQDASIKGRQAKILSIVEEIRKNNREMVIVAGRFSEDIKEELRAIDLEDDLKNLNDFTTKRILTSD